MAEPRRISPSWADSPCIVAAPGPSLTASVARECRIRRLTDYWKIIAVQDAYKLFPWADMLYGCDDRWWLEHGDCNGFQNEKWTSVEEDKDSSNYLAKKAALIDRLGIHCVLGKRGNTFSLDPGLIHYGDNSGFQAVNLALLKGCKRIVLVGFDMRHKDGKAHFFGDHPENLVQAPERFMAGWAQQFANAAKALPPDITIVNATPGSALTCFPMMELDDALSSLHWHGSEPHARTGTDGA